LHFQDFLRLYTGSFPEYPFQTDAKFNRLVERSKSGKSQEIKLDNKFQPQPFPQATTIYFCFSSITEKAHFPDRKIPLKSALYPLSS
jgi:hypothetical protein